MESYTPALSAMLRGETVPLGNQDLLIREKEVFTPRTKQNMGYIVSGVVIDDEGRILMMQEAKRSCHGQWYLPAGRVEADENFYDACMREVEEETGLQCRPTTLLSVEVQRFTWIRLNFAAEITGGTLKTTDKGDKESLQAQWFSREELRSINLRCHDILPVIDLALGYKMAAEGEKHTAMLPSLIAHKNLVYRCVFYQQDAESGEIFILQSTHMQQKNSASQSTDVRQVSTSQCNDIERLHGTQSDAVPQRGFPAIVLTRLEFNPYSTVRKLLDNCLKKKTNDDLVMIAKYLLNLEHCGKPLHEHDGTCLTFLVELKTKTPSEQEKLQKLKKNLHWTKLNGAEKAIFMQKSSAHGSVRFVLR